MQGSTPPGQSARAVALDLSRCDLAMDAPTLGREFSAVDQPNHSHSAHAEELRRLLGAHQSVRCQDDRARAGLQDVDDAEQRRARRIWGVRAVAGESAERVGDGRAQSLGLLVGEHSCHGSHLTLKRPKRTGREECLPGLGRSTPSRAGAWVTGHLVGRTRQV